MSDGASILVLEDDALLAIDLADVLRNAGFNVIGPAVTLPQAEHLLASTRCDAAVVDVNLGKTTSAPLAQALHERGIPFVAVSGYAELPPPFSGAVSLSKPFDYDALIAALRSLIDRR